MGSRATATYVTKASLNCACNVVKGISLGTFEKGFSSSLATSYMPRKHNTVRKFKTPANQSFVTKLVKSKGKMKMTVIEKNAVICPCGKGKGMYATFRARL